MFRGKWMLGITPALILLFSNLFGIRAASSTTCRRVSGPIKARNNTGPTVRCRTAEDARIGRIVRFGEYKWVAAVYHSQYEYPKCAGVILSEITVMTSCTCITEEEFRSYAFPDTVKSLMVVAGNPDADSPFHESRTIRKIKIHPYCDREWIGTRGDLAILEINKGFQTHFYNHVGVAPRYGNLNERSTMKKELEKFMNYRIVCEIVTFGYYEELPNSVIRREYRFHMNHTMRAIRVIFVPPNDFCKNTCPLPHRCVFDFFGREAACIAGVDGHIGPCGVVPGSPVFCNKNFWGIYTGPRNCSVPGPAAVPTLISFSRFFRGIDYDIEVDESAISRLNRISNPTTLQIFLLGLIITMAYSQKLDS